MRASLLAAALFSCIQVVHAADGLVTIQSVNDVKTTADKLVAAVEGKDIKVFNRIDHAAGAKSVDMELAPTELVIFGSPKVGTPLMQCAPTMGIDLPLKALIWQDADGKVWLAYYDPAYLAERHGIEGCEEPLKKAAGAMKMFAAAATQ